MNFINKGNPRPQDDLPYERQMFYIIKDYRRLTELLQKVSAYARKLEKELESTKEKRAKSALANYKMSEELVAARKEIKRLNGERDELRRKLKSKFSNAKCCVCGKQVKAGYVWDGKDVVCSDECGHIIFKDDPAAFDILAEEGKRMVWREDLADI